VFDGPVSALAGADTPTGRWLSGRERLDPLRIWWAEPDRPGRGDGAAPPLRLTGGAARGRADIGLDLRRGRVNVISGAPASGKTTALEALSAAVASMLDGRGHDGLLGAEGLTRLVHADAEAASRSRRSTLATYVGIWETIRELLAATTEARVRGLDAASFSLNLRGGRCEACRGLGVVHVDLTVLPEVSMPCEVCEGRRFARDVLEVRYKGLDAGQMLGLSADDALGRLAGHPRVEDGLRALREVGLGYVRLGQPTDTLSGGEAQRLKLARELMRALRSGGEGALFLLDEPALGLHPADVATLMALFGRLVATGGTVVLATSSAWLIEALAQASA
jgi:excinuclease ABC subunit A